MGGVGGFVEGDLGGGAGFYYEGAGGIGEDAIAGGDVGIGGVEGE